LFWRTDLQLFGGVCGEGHAEFSERWLARGIRINARAPVNACLWFEK
jgi:hypothetical protein